MRWLPDRSTAALPRGVDAMCPRPRCPGFRFILLVAPSHPAGQWLSATFVGGYSCGAAPAWHRLPDNRETTDEAYSRGAATVKRSAAGADDRHAGRNRDETRETEDKRTRANALYGAGFRERSGSASRPRAQSPLPWARPWPPSERPAASESGRPHGYVPPASGAPPMVRSERARQCVRGEASGGRAGVYEARPAAGGDDEGGAHPRTRRPRGPRL